MTMLLYASLLLIVLGIASLVVPIPHSETEGIKAGDLHIGVQTTHSEKVSPIVSVVLIAGGIVLAIAGTRSGALKKREWLSPQRGSARLSASDGAVGVWATSVASISSHRVGGK